MAASVGNPIANRYVDEPSFVQRVGRVAKEALYFLVNLVALVGMGLTVMSISGMVLTPPLVIGISVFSFICGAMGVTKSFTRMEMEQMTRVVKERAIEDLGKRRKLALENAILKERTELFEKQISQLRKGEKIQNEAQQKIDELQPKLNEINDAFDAELLELNSIKTLENLQRKYRELARNER